jgi:ATP-dependent exoDNAse (exonuclease V) beta subunit
MGFRPADDDAREKARARHETSFVLEAGAGTGKTTLLVDRALALVRTGRARLDEIAAVTFTENAATTMKLRLRERLERTRSDTRASGGERRRAGEALEVLERAQISTIHALCAAILGERPLECGVAPGFRVADEAETDLMFREAWEEWLADRLTGGDDLLLEALDSEIPLEGLSGWGERSSLRGLARTLLEQRDLEPLVAGEAGEAEAWRRELREKASRARELVAAVQPGDALAGRLTLLVGFAEEAERLSGPALATHLTRLETIPRSFGFKPRWPSAEALEEGRKLAAWTSEAVARWRAAQGSSLHGRLVRALLGVVEIYERRKAARGCLDFLDLLRRTRDALRDRDEVRRYFRARFRRLLIDEYQDTDPLQVEIAELLSAGAPGALVVVGDAKQSIYRFRRAEVRLFQRASERARRTPGHEVLQLTQNFRSRPSILRFANRVFGELIQESQEAGQPAYEPIVPPPDLPEEPSVVGLEFEADFLEGEELLATEAAALVRWTARAAKGKLEVRDPATGTARASRAGDMLVLVRRLTQIRHLEDALEAAGIRFTVEGGKSFFDRQEVHETLAVLRAIEDPSDRVSLVAALRSSFFGVSDRDIVSYALAGGALQLGAVDETRPGAPALAAALVLLETLHRERTRLSPPALLERLYDETRILAALTGSRRGEAQAANLEKVVALARQASDLDVLTLRGFTALLADRMENAREEPDLPSTRPGDPDAVRILSIHKAKGLEAPIVALHDTADNFGASADVIPLWDEKRVAVGFRKGCQPPGWDALAEAEGNRARAEGRRLLYVAVTRARDWLVIPKPPGTARVGAFWKELVERLPASSDADVLVVDSETLPVPESSRLRPDLRALAAAEGADALAARWEKERRTLVGTASQRPFVPVAATKAAAREAPPPVTAGAGPGGRDFGKLVHQILEWIPLDGGDTALAMAEALAPRYGLNPQDAARAAEAVRAALALPVLGRARRAARLWRELKLWFPVESELIEGSVDLVFEEDAGLVIVDYKTDRITEAQALAQAAHHAPQLQTYGRGLAVATGMSVKERLVVFTAIGRAVPV